MHASSGTTGKPTVVGYTAKDIENWSDLMARDFVMVGVRKGDIFQNAVNYGFSPAGLEFTMASSAWVPWPSPLEWEILNGSWRS